VSFMEEVRASQPVQPLKCPFAILDRENPEMGAEVDEAVFAKDENGSFVVTAISISKKLKEKGYPMGEDATRRHRRHDCQCEWK